MSGCGSRTVNAPKADSRSEAELHYDLRVILAYARGGALRAWQKSLTSNRQKKTLSDRKCFLSGCGSRTVNAPKADSRSEAELHYDLRVILAYARGGALRAWQKSLTSNRQKKTLSDRKCFLSGCGSRTRTYDLRVMSPTSYRLLHPATIKYCAFFRVLYYSII